MYVEGVERDSKYIIRAHNIFTHNSLNIQPIFNLKKFWKAKTWGFPTISPNDMYAKACQRCQRSK